MSKDNQSGSHFPLLIQYTDDVKYSSLYIVNDLIDIKSGEGFKVIVSNFTGLEDILNNCKSSNVFITNSDNKTFVMCDVDLFQNLRSDQLRLDHMSTIVKSLDVGTKDLIWNLAISKALKSGNAVLHGNTFRDAVDNDMVVYIDNKQH